MNSGERKKGKKTYEIDFRIVQLDFDIEKFGLLMFHSLLKKNEKKGLATVEFQFEMVDKSLNGNKQQEKKITLNFSISISLLIV